MCLNLWYDFDKMNSTLGSVVPLAMFHLLPLVSLGLIDNVYFVFHRTTFVQFLFSCNTQQEELLDVWRNNGQTPICKTLDIFFHKSLFMGLLTQQDMKYFWSYLLSKLRSNIIKGRQKSATYLQSTMSIYCIVKYLSIMIMTTDSSKTFQKNWGLLRDIIWFLTQLPFYLTKI